MNFDFVRYKARVLQTTSFNVILFSVDINMVSKLETLLTMLSLIQIQADCNYILNNYQNVIECPSSNYEVLIECINSIDSILNSKSISSLLIEGIDKLLINVNVKTPKAPHLLLNLNDEELLINLSLESLPSNSYEVLMEEKVNTNCLFFIKYKNTIITNLDSILKILVNFNVDSIHTTSISLKVLNNINSNINITPSLYIIINSNQQSSLIPHLIVNRTLTLIGVDCVNQSSCLCNIDSSSSNTLLISLPFINQAKGTITIMVYACLNDYDNISLAELDDISINSLILKEDK